MVGDFVAAEACSGESLAGAGHQRNGQIVLRQVQFSQSLATVEHRSWFDRQVIDRKMRCPGIHSLFQLFNPVLQGLAWEILNQIQAPGPQHTIRVGRSHPGDRLQQINAPVTPSKLLEHGIIEALPPEADAVHTSGDHRCEVMLIEARGVHFQGDFRTWLKAKPAMESIQKRSDLIRRQQRRRATTDVDRRQGRTAWHISDLTMEKREVVLDRSAARPLFRLDPISKRYDSEIAVVTAPMAEGNVEVGAAGREGIGHASGIRIELPRPEPMVDPLILLLFLTSGTAAGWMGVHLLPIGLVNETTDVEKLRLILSGSGGGIGLVAGLVFQRLRVRLMQQVRTMPTDLLVSRAVGLILGLLVANLLLLPVLLLPFSGGIVLLKPLLAVVSNVFFGILGSNLAEVHGRTLLRLFNPASTEALLVADGVLTPATAKILDTSVIIDGRIRGMLACGLLEGQVIVAESVISEMQQLSDSTNIEKRAKGRRGLKLLKDLRETYGRRLVINSTRYDGKGTDDRLLQLAEDTGGTLVTADFNLAQVAQVKDLKVMNLSELVIALRPEVQPGDELNLKIVREGKEASQGVGYLDDGTMVVVNEAKTLIGQRKPVVVTGALQTPTGRMVFARLATQDKGSAKPSKTSNRKPADPR